MSRPSKYPWSLWTDGQVHDIQKGRDYDCATATIRQALYMRAVDLRMTVKTTVLTDPPGLEFQFFSAQPQKAETRTWGPPVDDNDEPYDDRSWIPDDAIALLNEHHRGK